jgi:thioesterase domain-containing protein/acyl carrier protein
VDRRALAALKSADAAAGGGETEGPRTTMELVMLQIWRQVLGIQNIGVHDNFFDLGGHSLKAITLRQAIRDELGADIPLAAFFAEATPASLAEGARTHEGVAPPCLLTLRDGPQDAVPLILVHEVSGGVLEYLDLCRLIGQGRTVYGLVAPGYDSEEAPLTSVEAMAERYTADLLAVLPHGPYHLVGWSFGGLVAFEMARLLEARGECVALLGLLDAHPFGSGVDVRDRSRQGILSQIAERLDIDPALLSGHTPDDALEILTREVTGRGIVPDEGAGQALRRQVRVMEAHGEALASYRPGGTVAADLTLFEAGDAEEPIDRARWAERTTGSLQVVPVPGSHLSMVRPPHVEALAAALEERLPPAPAGG